MGNLKKADVGVKKTTADVAAIALKCSRGCETHHVHL
jgi:hypothetical protein